MILRTALERLEGVEKAEVSFWRARAVVHYRPEVVSPKAIAAHVREQIGYVLTPLAMDVERRAGEPSPR